MTNAVLERKSKVAMKGTIPVLTLPTLTGRGWEEMAALRYETIDHVVKAGDIRLRADGLLTLGGVEEKFRLTPFAATGLAWCSNSDDRPCETDEAAELINEGFKTQDTKEYRIRVTEGGTAIAILSPGYYPLKNSELVDGLQRMSKSYDAGMFYLSPYKTSIAIQSKKKFKMGKEELFAGAKVDNGEHGKKSFAALARMVQLICGNGAVIGTGTIMDIKRRHSNSDNNWEGFDIVGAVSEVITNVMDTQGLMEHLEDFSLRVDKVKQDTFKKVIQQGSFGAKQADAFAKSYEAQHTLRDRGNTETMYDVFNAVTAMKDYFPKSTFQWEEMGGDMFMDPGRWYAGSLLN